jgi:hypothetical protein
MNREITKGLLHNLPWWVAVLVFIGTIIIGIFIGAPIATDYYALSIPTEVSQLFALMPFVYFYYLIPLCLLSAYFFMLAKPSLNKIGAIFFISFSMFTVSGIFYVIGVSNYYGQ